MLTVTSLQPLQAHAEVEFNPKRSVGKATLFGTLAWMERGAAFQNVVDLYVHDIALLTGQSTAEVAQQMLQLQNALLENIGGWVGPGSSFPSSYLEILDEVLQLTFDLVDYTALSNFSQISPTVVDALLHWGIDVATGSVNWVLFSNQLQSLASGLLTPNIVYTAILIIGTVLAIILNEAPVVPDEWVWAAESAVRQTNRLHEALIRTEVRTPYWCKNFMRPLNFGVKNKEIIFLHAALRAEGSIISDDEQNEMRFGGTTLVGVRAFQEKHGVGVTGELDQITRDKLRETYGCGRFRKNPRFPPIPSIDLIKPRLDDFEDILRVTTRHIDELRYRIARLEVQLDNNWCYTIPPETEKEIKPGHRGASVTYIQAALGREGIEVDPAESLIDKFGASTRAGVKLFQQKNGIPQTGLLDRRTRNKLNAKYACPVLTTGGDLDDPGAERNPYLEKLKNMSARLLTLRVRLARVSTTIPQWCSPYSWEGMEGELVAGERSARVVYLQSALIKEGMYIPDAQLLTGRFGRATREALQEFKEKYSLPLNGLVNEASRLKLRELYACGRNPGTRTLWPSPSPAVDSLYQFEQHNGSQTLDRRWTYGNSSATVHGATAVPHGRYGSGMEFDGVDDRIELPPIRASATLGVWIFPLETGHTMTVARGDNFPDGAPFSQWLRIAPDGHFQLVINDGTEHVITAESKAVLGGWSHVAVSTDKQGHVSLIVNGIPQGSVLTVSLPAESSVTWTIGATVADGAATAFRGYMDDVARFNGPASLDAIRSLRSMISQPKQPIPRLTPSVDLKLGGSDGPVGASPGFATLNWTSQNVDSCEIGGEFYGPNGTATVSVPENREITHTIRCSSGYGVASDSVRIVPKPRLTVSVSLNGTPRSETPLYIYPGDAVRVSWDSNASECYLAGDLASGSVGSTGERTVSFTTIRPRRLYVACTGPGGVTDYTLQLPMMSAPLPSVQLTANGSPLTATVNAGGSVNLQWTATRATQCARSWRNETTGAPLSGSEVISNITANLAPSITCRNQYGATTGRVNVRLNRTTAAVDLKASLFPDSGFADDPLPVRVNDGVYLQWTGQNLTSCTGSWSALPTTGTGSAAISLTSNNFPNTVSITCTGLGGSVTDAVALEPIQLPGTALPTATLQINGVDTNRASAPENSQVTVSWNSTNAASCWVDGPFPLRRGTSGSTLISPMRGDALVRIECTSSSGAKARDYALVKVSSSAYPLIQTDIKANGSDSDLTVPFGESAMLTWSTTTPSGTGVQSCSTGVLAEPSSFKQLSRPTAGAEQSGAIVSDQTYFVRCLQSGGFNSNVAVYDVVTVKPAVADLRVRSIQAPTLRAGLSGLLTATVENVGQAPAPASEAAIVVSGAVRSTIPVPTLTPGETYSIGIPLSLASPGQFSVSVRADSNRTVFERDEQNNSTVVNVVAAP